MTWEPTILDTAVETVDARDREEFGQFMAGRWPGLVRLAYGLTGDRWLAAPVPFQNAGERDRSAAAVR